MIIKRKQTAKKFDEMKVSKREELEDYPEMMGNETTMNQK